MAETTNLPVQSKTQFRRTIIVDILNFQTGEKISIDSGKGLHIDYNFNKNYDITQEQNTGYINIYGLTEETFKKIGKELSEVHLYVSYGLDVPQERLFTAVITSVDRNYNDARKAVKISVSSNFKEFAFNTVKYSIKEGSPIGILKDVVEGQGYTQAIKIVADDETTKKLADWYELSKHKVQINTNFRQALDYLQQKFMLALTSDENKHLEFTVKDSAKPFIISQTAKGYAKLQRPESKTTAWYEDTKMSEDAKRFVEMSFSGKDEEGIALVLSPTTGLIGYPEFSRNIVTVSEDWDEQDNEAETYDSQVASQKKELKEKERIQKYNERAAKAKEKGKEIKPLKPRKVGTKKIKRTYVKIRALINPLVRPQSQIKIISGLSEYNGIYRVRSINFSGSNYQENIMEIFAEDTNDKFSQDLTPEELATAQREDEQNLQQQQITGATNEPYEIDQ